MTDKNSINADIKEIVETADIENCAGFHEEVYENDAGIDSNRQGAEEDKATAPVNHDEDVLINNETTFFGLLDILRKRPEAVAAEREEIRIKEEEERDARKATLSEEFGEEYDSQYDSHAAPDQDSVYKDEIKKQSRRPGIIKLRRNYHRVAVKDIGNEGRCEVYENGYAVYDNGDRRTVVWVPDCGSVTYYFTPLRDSEKESFKQKDKLGEDVFGSLPWYHAVVIAGEDNIERSLVHPKSEVSISELDDFEDDVKPNHKWRCGGHIESPEEAYIRKETEKEWRESLTKKQREVYDLYFIQGYTQKQIGELLGIKQQSVIDRIEAIIKKIKKIEKIF